MRNQIAAHAQKGVKCSLNISVQARRKKATNSSMAALQKIVKVISNVKQVGYVFII